MKRQRFCHTSSIPINKAGFAARSQKGLWRAWWYGHRWTDSPEVMSGLPTHLGASWPSVTETADMETGPTPWATTGIGDAGRQKPKQQLTRPSPSRSLGEALIGVFRCLFQPQLFSSKISVICMFIKQFPKEYYSITRENARDSFSSFAISAVYTLMLKTLELYYKVGRSICN